MSFLTKLLYKHYEVHVHESPKGEKWYTVGYRYKHAQWLGSYQHWEDHGVGMVRTRYKDLSEAISAKNTLDSLEACSLDMAEAKSKVVEDI